MTKVICKNRKPLFNKNLNGLWTGSEITRRCSGRGAEILYHEEVQFVRMDISNLNGFEAHLL